MVGKSEIEWLSHKICDEIFHTAERVFIFYYFEDQENTEIAWATSNYVNGKLEININDFIL